jgi:hypothetical protein
LARLPGNEIRYSALRIKRRLIAKRKAFYHGERRGFVLLDMRGRNVTSVGGFARVGFKNRYFAGIFFILSFTANF